MPDPTPLLSVTTGASAGLVAIIGGLLVARYVSLDSEQQGAQRLLNEAEERLTVATRRHSHVRQALIEFEADAVLGDEDAVMALAMGTTDAAELRRLSTAAACSAYALVVDSWRRL